jgi:hypothetical protein
VRCYKDFDRDFTNGLEKSASCATTSYDIDTNWYSDTNASDHITGELEKLSTKDKYHNGDQVHVTNGSGMKKDQIGRSIVHTLNSDLILNGVLDVPQASNESASRPLSGFW